MSDSDTIKRLQQQRHGMVAWIRELAIENEELQEKLSDATLEIGILSGEPSG